MNGRKVRDHDYEEDTWQRRRFNAQRRIDKHPKNIYNMLDSEEDFEYDDELELDEGNTK
jgi:hypothetical protein